MQDNISDLKAQDISGEHERDKLDARVDAAQGNVASINTKLAVIKADLQHQKDELDEVGEQLKDQTQMLMEIQRSIDSRNTRPDLHN
jgi:predicted  nucleic acid-binding Zn-ribbon protein